MSNSQTTLPHEVCAEGQVDMAEICLKFGWLFGRFEDTKILF